MQIFAPYFSESKIDNGKLFKTILQFSTFNWNKVVVSRSCSTFFIEHDIKFSSKVFVVLDENSPTRPTIFLFPPFCNQNRLGFQPNKHPKKERSHISYGFFPLFSERLTYYSPLQPKAIVTCSFGLIAEILYPLASTK